MAKISKIEVAKHQIDAAIRMFFDNEDIIPIHTLSRAGFRVMYDIAPENEQKKALDAYIKKVGEPRFNEITNFLKHADRDPDADIDDNFGLYTEAGIGFALVLYQHQTGTLTPEMKAFAMWQKMMRPEFFELPEQLSTDIKEWKSGSHTDPDKIETQANARLFGKNLLHWVRLRMGQPSRKAAP
jgi:hypothetical protein